MPQEPQTDLDMLKDDFELTPISSEAETEITEQECVLTPNSFPERETVVNEQKKRAEEGKKVSANSKIIKAYREALPTLSPLLTAIAVGLMLGDISIVANTDKTAYSIKFEWGGLNKAYAYHVWNTFSAYILGAPREQIRTNENGNQVTTWCFQSVSTPHFKFLATLFHPGKKKTLDVAKLYEFITPATLAFWYMDDGYIGSPGRYGLFYATHGFTPSGVDELCLLLTKKFGLKCWRKTNKGKPVIYISGESYSLFFSLVKPYIIPSIRRKFPVGPRTNWED